MAAVISSLVYTVKDLQGNNRVEGWILCEFREQYLPGGVAIDLRSSFRYINTWEATPASGAVYVLPVAADDSYPGANTQSGRVVVWGLASNAFSVVVLSGTVIATSGINSGLASGLRTVVTGISGSIEAGLNTPFAELLSGVQLSGARYKLHVIGG